jgi:hypothetical protein
MKCVDQVGIGNRETPVVIEINLRGKVEALGKSGFKQIRKSAFSASCLYTCFASTCPHKGRHKPVWKC